MKVQVITEKCQGHGRCYSLAPELFDSDDYGNSVVLGDGDVPAGLEGVGPPRRAQLPRAGGGHRDLSSTACCSAKSTGRASPTARSRSRSGGGREPRAKAGRRARFAGGVLMIDDVRIVEASRDHCGRRAQGRIRRTSPRCATSSSEFGEGDIYRIALHWVGPDEREALRADDDLSAEELAAIRAPSSSGSTSRAPAGRGRGRCSRSSPSGPRVRAPDLAASLGLDTRHVQARRPQAQGARPHREPDGRLPHLPRGQASLILLARAGRRDPNAPRKPVGVRRRRRRGRGCGPCRRRPRWSRP